MPQLAEEILKRNDQVRVDKSAPVINFAGFLVGNPYTDARSNQVQQFCPLLAATAAAVFFLQFSGSSFL